MTNVVSWGKSLPPWRSPQRPSLGTRRCPDAKQALRKRACECPKDFRENRDALWALFFLWGWGVDAATGGVQPGCSPVGRLIDGLDFTFNISTN